MIGKPRIEEAIKRKAVVSPVAMGQIVEEDHFIRTVHLTEQAKHLTPEGTEADKANPFGLVATHWKAGRRDRRSQCILRGGSRRKHRSPGTTLGSYRCHTAKCRIASTTFSCLLSGRSL